MNLLVLQHPVLHTKFQGHQPFGSGEDFLKVFTIYGHDGFLGRVTWTVWTNFCSPIPRRLHMKFSFNWPGVFREEDIWKCWNTCNRRRQRPTCTISSPMSLKARWANNACRYTTVRQQNKVYIEPRHEKTCLCHISEKQRCRSTSASTESNQQMHRLITTFVVRCLDNTIQYNTIQALFRKPT